MRAVEHVHKGTQTVRGWIITPAVTGEVTAQHRVISGWRQGSQLYRLPDQQWLLLSSEPIEISAKQTPGAPVIREGGGFVAAPGLRVAADELLWWSHGHKCQAKLENLERLDPADWIDLGVELIDVDPIVADTVPAPVEPAPPPPTPDLRAGAQIKEQTHKATRFTEELKTQSARSKRRGPTTTGGQTPSAPRRSAGTLAKLLLRSPLRNEIGRRHARYVEALTRQFTAGDLDEALRNAIPLGGLGQAALSLRLPGRRDHLRLSSSGPGGGKSVPFGPTVQQHLQQLYRQAATELEAAGRIDEAAFVLAELLNNPAECVALLERHRRFETAATLAENRDLDAALTIRLWWLAGNHHRSLRLARRHHAYQAVLTRLDDVDPTAAREFRLLWVDELERSGNLLGAVTAGWPDPTIRPLLTNVIERGISSNDDWSLALHAYRTALHPSQQNRHSLFNQLNDQSPTPAALRFFGHAVAEAEANDPVADREITSRATRALLRLPRPRKDRQFETTFRSIRDRADPVLAADLPPAATPAKQPGCVEIPDQPPGLTRIHDVVPLTNGTTLVALGELGCRIMTADGRTTASWDIPCHHFVAADHTGTVALLTQRNQTLETHVLDLTTRRTRHYGTVRSGLWATSFDGATWAVVDERGLTFLDLLADRPTIAWRELEPGWICHQLTRSEDFLAAIIAIPTSVMVREPRLELWRWELPTRRLAVRRRIAPPDNADQVHLLADGTSIWQQPEVQQPGVVIAPSGAHGPAPARFDADDELRTSGSMVARRSPTGALKISESIDGSDTVSATVADGSWGFRVHAGRVAIWDTAGRYSVIDIEHSHLAATGRITA